MSSSSAKVLDSFYKKLYKEFGPLHWWPARTKFEVIVGSILTQNTNWGNVEKALANLRKAKVFSPKALHALSLKKIATYIKPSGYFNIKAKRLKNFLDFFFKEYQGSIAKMQRESLEVLRPKLLSVNGVGAETADSILLYALNKPTFVVDAYTMRFLYRHNMIEKGASYQDVQKLFMDHLPENVPLYNEYHAQIVMLGKYYCKPTPQCEECPLRSCSYSLKYKCRVCHRSLPKSSDRRKRNDHYFCRDCYSV